MAMPSPSIDELARRLAASSQIAADRPAQAAALLNENLRTSLMRFTGTDGFAALLRRAVALASAEVPALRSAKVSKDGRLEGIGPLIADAGAAREAAAIAVTVRMLELLVTLIGEPLTRRLVLQACPETSPEE